MNTPNQSAQVEQHQTTPLNIDFNHRLGDSVNLSYEPNNALHLVDAVNGMTSRADAILNMLEAQFLGEVEWKLSDEIVYNIIEAALKEIQDVRNVVNAFQKADFLAKQIHQA